MGAKVIIFGKILNSNFLKGLVHSALQQEVRRYYCCCCYFLLTNTLSSKGFKAKYVQFGCLLKKVYLLCSMVFLFHTSPIQVAFCRCPISYFSCSPQHTFLESILYCAVAIPSLLFSLSKPAFLAFKRLANAFCQENLDNSFHAFFFGAN